MPNLKHPSQANPGDAGYDVFSTELKSKLLWPFRRFRFKLGFAIIGEPGKVYKIEGKSGLAGKGITTIGNIIDNQYRGEVSALLVNVGFKFIRINPGDKIAQILIQNVDDSGVLVIDNSPLELTKRGHKAYGSSGR